MSSKACSSTACKLVRFLRQRTKTEEEINHRSGHVDVYIVIVRKESVRARARTCVESFMASRTGMLMLKGRDAFGTTSVWAFGHVIVNKVHSNLLGKNNVLAVGLTCSLVIARGVLACTRDSWPRYPLQSPSELSQTLRRCIRKYRRGAHGRLSVRP